MGGAERQLEISVTECMECEVAFGAIAVSLRPETSCLTRPQHGLTTVQYHCRGTAGGIR